MDFDLLGFSGLREMFNVHPAFVHYPIALLPSALLFYLLGLVIARQPFLLAGRILLYLSFVGVVVSVITGLSAEDSFPHNETIHHLIETHETIGLVLLGVTTLLVLWSFWQNEQRPKKPWLFVAVLAFASYLALQTSDIGGRMVYLEGAAVKPVAEQIGEVKDESSPPASPNHRNGVHPHQH